MRFETENRYDVLKSRFFLSSIEMDGLGFLGALRNNWSVMVPLINWVPEFLKGLVKFHVFLRSMCTARAEPASAHPISTAIITMVFPPSCVL